MIKKTFKKLSVTNKNVWYDVWMKFGLRKKIKIDSVTSSREKSFMNTFSFRLVLFSSVCLTTFAVFMLCIGFFYVKVPIFCFIKIVTKCCQQLSLRCFTFYWSFVICFFFLCSAFDIKLLQVNLSSPSSTTSLYSIFLSFDGWFFSIWSSYVTNFQRFYMFKLSSIAFSPSIFLPLTLF